MSSDTKVRGPHLPSQPPPPPPAGVHQDDEPLERPTAEAESAATPNGGGLVLSTQCEFPALARGASMDRFAVLVHAKAPSDVARAPLDLVTVLDVSTSMKGRKLALLKQAMCFVVDQLGPADRLSVVTFSAHATRITRLARMSAAGKASAKFAVGALVVARGTNIGAGLRVGAQVLAGRREKNSVAAMILLSDGHDKSGSGCLATTTVMPNGTKSYTICGGGGAPIHTFGFGTNHDRGVRIQAVKSGAYASHVGDDGRAASIDAGELYDGEERRFLVLVYVPRVRAAEEVTRLVKASCTYRVVAMGQAHTAAARAAVVQRPPELATMPAPSVAVERERVRLAATEDIAAARVAADGGQNAGAARILEARLKAVEESAPGAAGDDPTCEAIKEELRDLTARVGDEVEYLKTGRACLLAGMSSHAQQRASGMDVQSSATSKPSAYLTPKMEEMVNISSEKRGGGSSSGWKQPAKLAKIEEERRSCPPAYQRGRGAANMAAVTDSKKKTKKVMVRVHQEFIDGILEAYPFKPFPCDPEEIEKKIKDPKRRELLISMTASVAATIKAVRAKEEAIVQQYYAKGYAEEEIEVTDDDEDVPVEDGSERISDAEPQPQRQE